MAGWGGVVGTIGKKTVGGDDGNLIQAAGNAVDIYGAATTAASDASNVRSQVSSLGQISADAGANANQQLSIDNALRSRLLTQTGNLGQVLTDAQTSMGAFGGTYFDANNLNTAIGTRVQAYQDLADRAVTNTNSVAEGSLITRGVDVAGSGSAVGTSVGDSARQQLTNQAAALYQDSYNRAVTDAITSQTGAQSLIYGGMDEMTKQRAAALSEDTSALAPEITAESAIFGKGLTTAGQLDYSALAGRYQSANISAQLAKTSGQSTGSMFDAFANNDSDAVAKLLGGSTSTPTGGFAAAAMVGY